jgi:hypothetical protein
MKIISDTNPKPVLLSSSGKGRIPSIVAKTTKIIYNVAPIGPTIINPLKKDFKKRLR